MIHPIWIVTPVGVAAAAAGVGIWLCARKHPARTVRDEHERGHDALAEGLARHASAFDGLYEGIYQGAERGDPAGGDALKEWRGRAAHLEGDEVFVRQFAARFGEGAENGDIRRQCGALLVLLKEAGVTRRQETERTMDPTARREYIFLGEKAPEDGEVCRVVKPAWECRGRVVEQGLIMAEEDGQ